MELLAFKAISNGALRGETLPTRLKLLDWGSNPAVREPAPIVNEITAAVLSANQRKRGYERVAIDYEHRSVGKDTPEPQKVAGYGVPVVIPGEGLFLEEITYTPSGLEFAREYEDLSPAVAMGADGTVQFLHSVALTRQGAVDGLTFFSAELNAKGNAMEIAELAQQVEALQKALNDVSAKLAAALAVNAVPVETFTAKVAELDGKLTTLSATHEATVAELTGRITTLSAEHQAELTRRDKEALLAQATAAGKVVPLSAEAIAALPVAELKASIEALPVTVPLSARTPRATPTVAPTGADVIVQFNAIKDPLERARFWREHGNKL